jgi:hypothetical protein
MTVYVDDANIPATVANGRARHTSRWCHLFSDTSDAELHEFAARIGLKRAWFQKPDSPLQTHRHYDLTAGKRRQAVAAGAVEITWLEAGQMMVAEVDRLNAGEPDG